jgi:hypothetical protein
MGKREDIAMIEILSNIMLVLGVICIGYASLRITLIGKAHVGRRHPLDTRTVTPMAPDLMAKMNVALRIGLIGGVFLLASWGLPKLSSSRERSTDEVWSDFTDDIIAFAQRGDVNSLVDKLTFYKDTDLGRLKRILAEAGQEGSAEAEEGTEQERRQQAVQDAELFVNSYSDLFDGKPRRFSTRETEAVPGLKLYSLIIWVEKDGSFHGIKIDNLCTIGANMKVLDWVVLSSYEMDSLAHGPIRKKKAILRAETASECNFPRDSIMYEMEYVGGMRPSSAW